MLDGIHYFMRGTPYIYQGQEIGMTNSDIDSIDGYQDLETHNIYRTAKKYHLPNSYINKTIKNSSRDNARTPMQWNDEKNAGFTTGKPWLKINDNCSFINVENSLKDEDSIFKYYQKLLKVRQNERLVIDGKYIDLLPKHKKIYAYKREGNKESLIVIANYSSSIIKLPLNNLDKYEVLINNYPDFNSKELQPYQAVVLKVKN